MPAPILLVTVTDAGADGAGAISVAVAHTAAVATSICTTMGHLSVFAY